MIEATIAIPGYTLDARAIARMAEEYDPTRPIPVSIDGVRIGHVAALIATPQGLNALLDIPEGLLRSEPNFIPVQQ